MIGYGKHTWLMHDPMPTNLPHAAHLEREQCAVVQAHGEIQALCERQREIFQSPHGFFNLVSIATVLFVVLLAGCQSTQEVYLARATDHVTTVEIEQTLGHPSYVQALDTGQRHWLYHQDRAGSGGRDFTPYCQDLWLTFDQEGVLRTRQKQRC